MAFFFKLKDKKNYKRYAKHSHQILLFCTLVLSRHIIQAHTVKLASVGPGLSLLVNDSLVVTAYSRWESQAKSTHFMYIVFQKPIKITRNPTDQLWVEVVKGLVKECFLEVG